MLRFYVRVALMLTLLFVVCGVGLIAFGGTQPINPALRGFVEGCENTDSVCWYGIISFETRIESAHAILIEEGYTLSRHFLYEGDQHFPEAYIDTYQRSIREGCNKVNLFYEPNAINPRVILLDVSDCQGVYVADVIEIFGIPRWIDFRTKVLVFYSCRHPVYFSGSLQPFSNVRSVDYGGGCTCDPAFEWHGFLLFWRYYQFDTQVSCP